MVSPAEMQAQGLVSEEAVRRMRVADGFEVQLVASEPLVRQLRPILTPLGLRLRFVVHAVQYVVEIERMIEQFVDERFLILQHNRIVSLLGPRR